MLMHYERLQRLAAYFARGIPLTTKGRPIQLPVVLYLGWFYLYRPRVSLTGARYAERSEARTTVCKFTGKETFGRGPASWQRHTPMQRLAAFG